MCQLSATFVKKFQGDADSSLVLATFLYSAADLSPHLTSP